MEINAKINCELKFKNKTLLVAERENCQLSFVFNYEKSGSKGELSTYSNRQTITKQLLALMNPMLIKEKTSLFCILEFEYFCRKKHPRK